MVAEHLQFLYSECTTMVQEERRKDLANMYPLLKSVSNGVTVLVDTVLDHIKSQGLQVCGILFSLGFQNTCLLRYLVMSPCFMN